jgi:hypothetical protein
MGDERGTRPCFGVKANPSSEWSRSVLLNVPQMPFVVERFQRPTPAVVSVAHLW